MEPDSQKSDQQRSSSSSMMRFKMSNSNYRHQHYHHQYLQRKLPIFSVSFRMKLKQTKKMSIHSAIIKMIFLSKFGRNSANE